MIPTAAIGSLSVVTSVVQPECLSSGEALIKATP